MTEDSIGVRKRGRPPKSQGDLREVRQALLEAGVAVLTERGFSSTGIEEILRSIGVPKGSFYNFFASKESFGTELIAHYNAYFVGKLDRFFLDETKSPLERIDAFFADAERGMKRFGFRRGCLIGNLGQEIGALPEAYRALLLGASMDWQRRAAHVLELARRHGQIAATVDCEESASFFWIGWEGAVLRAKLERKATPLRLFARTFRRSIGA